MKNQHGRSVTPTAAWISFAALLLAVSGCNGLGTGASGEQAGSVRNSPSASQSTVGESCHSNDPNNICLGLNYVVYKDDGTRPVVSEDIAVNNTKAINSVWKQCGISFQIDKLQMVNPADHKLQSGSEAQYQLDEIRQAFSDKSTLLVVTTGNWGSVKNAWTQPPGAGIYGVVMEASVGDYPNIIAHELGHYVGLDHVDDASNVMDALIYPDSTTLDRDQCETARSTANQYWKAMMR